MKMIEFRSFIVIIPKEPFIEWVKKIDTRKLFYKSATNHKTVYLVDAFNPEKKQEVNLAIKYHYKEIFENELSDWEDNKKKWPVKRDYITFLEWFEVIAIDTGFDLSEDDEIL